MTEKNYIKLQSTADGMGLRKWYKKVMWFLIAPAENYQRHGLNDRNGLGQVFKDDMLIKLTLK